MPSKKRSQPCDDTLKLGHIKHSKYQDVNAVNKSTLNEYREKLPQYNWKDGTRLCLRCRLKAIEKVNERSAGLHFVETVRDRGHEGLVDLLGISQSQDGSANQPSSSLQAPPNMTGQPTNFDRASLSPVSPAPSAPVLQQITLPALPSAHVAVSSPSTSPGSQHSPFPTAPVLPVSPAPSAPPLPSPLSTPGRDSVFVTPTRPTTSRVHSLHNTPSSFLSSGPSVICSPSIAGTNYSTDSGSVYHDEAIAKIELNKFLQQLGVEQLHDKHAKARPRRLFKIMNAAMAAFKKKFQDYVGRPLPEEECNCSFCQLVPAAVKAKLPEQKLRKDKILLLSILPPSYTIKKMHEELGVTIYMARMVSKLRAEHGPFTSPVWSSTGHPISEDVVEKVEAFYLSDDNSRTDPTASTSINVLVDVEHNKRDRKERRIMYANLKDSYQEFKRLHSDLKIGISKFAKLRPKNVRWPGHKGIHISCCCPYHENFKLLLEGLKNASFDAMEDEFTENPSVAALMQLFDDYNSFVAYLLCDPSRAECYMGYCDKCPIYVHLERLLSYSEGNEIRYDAWEKNELVTRIEEHSVFAEKFPEILAKFILHDFIYRQQKDYIKSLKCGDLQNGTSSVLTVDYGENYSFVVQNAVQAWHWNNRQATVHPFVLYTASQTPGKPEYKTYFVISDDLAHDAHAFHSFRVRVLEKVKEQYPHLRHIDYVSDGASSQYKNHFNIANLLFHEDDFNLTARWIYTCTCHGKSTCDAMSSCVKRTVRLRSKHPKPNDEPIINPERMFRIASRDLTSSHLEFLYVTRDDNDYWRDALKPRYAKVKKIKGTRQWHYLEVGQGKTLISKRFGFSTDSETHCCIESSLPTINEEMETDEVIEPITGEFYAFPVRKTYQIGQAAELYPKKETARFLMMKKAGPGGVSLTWPNVEKCQEFEYRNIIRKVDPPKYLDDKKSYRLSEDDQNALRLVLE